MPETERPQPIVARLTVIKDGVSSDKLGEVFTGEPPVVTGMYVHKYVTARLGRKIKVIIEADDGE